MATHISPLHQTCLKRIARMLKDDVWKPDLPEDENPFRRLPSVLIDELITYVAEISDSKDPLLSSQLQLLIRTGRVRHLKLEDKKFGIRIYVDKENLTTILKELSSASRPLVAVKINMKLWHSRIAYDVRDTLTSLLLVQARNIRHVESNIPFDITALRGAVQLEELIIYFRTEYCVSEFLRVHGEIFESHSCLKKLFVHDHKASLDILFILKYCTELISINCDISKSIEMLHAKELRSGSLTHKYKLQKCSLGYGSEYLHYDRDIINSFSTADSLSVRIAAFTCPYLRDVKIYVKDFETISALSECRNLNTLAMQWQGLFDTDYNAAVRSLLEKPDFGQRLKAFELENFSAVDFDSIGKCCPNLERLKIDNRYSCNISKEVLPTSFQKLKFLDLLFASFLTADRVSRDLPLGLLSTAVDLEELSLHSISDGDLTVLLEANPLSKLKELYLWECDLTLSGMRKVACSLTSLESFILYKLPIPEEWYSIFREVNPRVKLRDAWYPPFSDESGDL